MTATKVRTAVGAPDPDGLHLLEVANKALAARRDGDTAEAERLRAEGRQLARRMLGRED